MGLWIMILIDAAVLCGIVMLVNQGESIEFFNAFVISAVLSVGAWILSLVITAFGALAVLAVATPLALALFCDLSVKRAVIAGVLMFCYKS